MPLDILIFINDTYVESQNYRQMRESKPTVTPQNIQERNRKRGERVELYYITGGNSTKTSMTSSARISVSLSPNIDDTLGLVRPMSPCTSSFKRQKR